MSLLFFVFATYYQSKLIIKQRTEDTFDHSTRQWVQARAYPAQPAGSVPVRPGG